MSQVHPNYSLKRTHSTEKEAEVPLLPKLTDADILLQIFTHKSLRRTEDNERLGLLGKKVLDAVVTEYVFRKRPIMKAEELRVQSCKLLSDSNYDMWVTTYGLREKLRCSPDARRELNSREETRSIFHAYVAGVFMSSGIVVVQNWVHSLLAEREPPASVKRIKSEPTSPEPETVFFASQPPPSPRPPPPPPPAAQAQPPNPLAPAQPHLAFLPLFNQTANQRRVSVHYVASFEGPSHSGRWTVQCVVNGIPKGVGSGSSKNIAKEMAAREAYYAMGWT